MAQTVTTEGQLRFNVILLGDSGVGKTQLIKVYDDKGFNEQSRATMGVDYVTLTKRPKDAQSDVRVMVWDTAGAERFRSLSQAFYKRAEGAIIGFDLTHRNSFDNVSNWVSSVRDQCPPGLPLILVGNKCDLEREIDRSECEALAREINMPYFETSAKEDINVNQAFQTIIDQVYASQ